MISIFEIKKSLIDILKKSTDCTVYSHIKEDFKKPAYFTDFNMISQKRITPILYRKNVRLRVIYFTENGEIDLLHKLDELNDVFGYKFKVGDRYLDILDIEYKLDTDNEYLIFTFRLDFIDRRVRDKAEIMKYVEVDMIDEVSVVDMIEK